MLLVLTQGFMWMWVYIYMCATKFIGCLPMEIGGLNDTCSSWSSVWLWIGHASVHLFDLFGVFIFFSYFLHAHLPGVTPPVVPLFCSQHEYPWQGELRGITCLEASLFTPLPCIAAALVLWMWQSRAWHVPLSLWWWEEEIQYFRLFLG